MKSLIFIAICALFLGSAAYLASMYLMRGPERPTAVAKQNVQPPVYALCLAADVNAGDILRKGALEWKPIVGGTGGRQLFIQTENPVRDINDAVLVTALTRGTFLEEQHILLPSDPGYLTQVLGQGMRAKSIRVDKFSDYRSELRRGDHVDLILTYVAPVAKGKPAEHMARTLLHNARIIDIDDHSVQKATGVSKTGREGANLTFAVSAAETKMLSVAEELGSLSIVLLGQQESRKNKTQADTTIFRERDLVPGETQAVSRQIPLPPRQIRVMRGSDITVLSLSERGGVPVPAAGN